MYVFLLGWLFHFCWQVYTTRSSNWYLASTPTTHTASSNLLYPCDTRKQGNVIVSHQIILTSWRRAERRNGGNQTKCCECVYLWFLYLIFINRKTKAMMMPIMAKTEMTMNKVMLMRDGVITTVLRSTGGPSPPDKHKCLFSSMWRSVCTLHYLSSRCDSPRAPTRRWPCNIVRCPLTSWLFKRKAIRWCLN